MLKILIVATTMMVIIVLVQRHLGKITDTNGDLEINSVGQAAETGTMTQEQSILKLAEVLSKNSVKVLKKINHCIEDPEGYLEKYEEDEEEREVVADFAWYELIAILQENRYAWFIDWRGGYEEVRNAVDILIKKKNMPMPDWSWAEGEDHEQYRHMATGEILSLIHKKLKGRGITLASMDAGGDDYVLLVLDQQEYLNVKDLAAQAGYLITTDF